MTVFLIVCVLLVVLLLAILYWPSRRSDALERDLRQENTQWYRLRRAELEQEEPSLAEDAELRLLEDERQGPGQPPLRSRHFPRWLVFLPMALAAVLLYWQLGWAPDVLISRRLEGLSGDSSPETVAALIRDVEARSRHRPENQDYLAILGRYAMGLEAYGRAEEAYEKLLQLRPEDPSVLASAAQAEFLAAGRELTPSAEARARRAVSMDPGQRTALSLLGMAAFENGDYAAAITHWERLLARSGKDSQEARLLTSVIGMARERLAARDGTVAQEPAPDLGVTVRVALPQGVAPDPAATVFVFARSSAGDSRMPLAVRRFSAQRLPVAVRLTDADSMAGASLSGAARVDVSVQVSPSGRPGEAHASHSGTVQGVEPTGPGGDPVAIEVRPTGN